VLTRGSWYCRLITELLQKSTHFSAKNCLKMEKELLFNEYNTKVTVKASKIVGGGKGVFAAEKILNGEIVCTFGGALIDKRNALHVKPTYTANFENGRGWAIIGDNDDGDLGHLANGIHPMFAEPEQNARFDINPRSKKYLSNKRGRFNVIAKRDLEIGDEVIVCYGDGYWNTMLTWETDGPPVKKPNEIARDVRAAKRGERN
jgi:hypothetical protein